jgi:hypothetical protein
MHQLPEWILYPGKWGIDTKLSAVSSILSIFDGPGSPPFADKWKDPIAWAGLRGATTTLAFIPVPEVRPGEQFTVDVLVEATDVANVQLAILFNPDVLEATRVEVGEVIAFARQNGIPISWAVGEIDNVQGAISNVRAESPFPLTGSGSLLTITFEAKASGQSILELQNTTLTSLAGDLIPHRVMAGEVTSVAEGTHRFVMALAPGLNMVSLPLMPSEPYTARTLAERIRATVVIQLDVNQQKFVGYTVGAGDGGFPIEGGKGYIVNVPDGGATTFTGKAWENRPAAPGADRQTGAWAFVVSGELQNAETDRTYTVVAKNLRTGAVATDVIASHRGHFAATWANLSRGRVVEAGDPLQIALLDSSENLVAGPFLHNVDMAHIRNAYLRLPLVIGDVRPTETTLAQNFPNPFNPETWIPYQLGTDVSVKITIYDAQGRRIRTLLLGHQTAGEYITTDKAAYWDGRSDTGEPVSSGTYFYHLQADDYQATKKMILVK